MIVGYQMTVDVDRPDRRAVPRFIEISLGPVRLDLGTGDVPRSGRRHLEGGRLTRPRQHRVDCAAVAGVHRGTAGARMALGHVPGRQVGIRRARAQRRVEPEISLDLALALLAIRQQMHQVVQAAVEVAGRQGERDAAVAQPGKPQLGIVADQPPLKIREPWPLVQPVPGVGESHRRATQYWRTSRARASLEAARAGSR